MFSTASVFFIIIIFLLLSYSMLFEGLGERKKRESVKFSCYLGFSKKWSPSDHPKPQTKDNLTVSNLQC